MNILTSIRKKLDLTSRNKRGQSTIEYILILFVVLMIFTKFKAIIGQKVVDLANQVGGDLTQQTQENTN